MQTQKWYARLTHNNALIRFEGGVHAWLVQHSITVLRVSLGAIFLGFGALKLVPGLSPAENLVESTISVMTLGLVPDHLGVVITAVIECFIGGSLIAGRWLRLTIYLLAVELLGVLSPLVLLPGRLFDGPHHAPTLEGQYVLKDIVLVAAAMVISTQFRGAEIVAPDDWDLDLRRIPDRAPAAADSGE